MKTRVHQQGEWEVEIKYFEAVFGKGELRQYAIEEPGVLRSRKWRSRFGETVMPLFEQFAGAQNIEFETPEDLLKLLPLVQSIVLDALDEVFDLLILYSPELEADREWLEDNATERQIIAAFMEVLQLAVPFEVGNIIARLNGLTNPTIGSNSPSANGDTILEKMSA